MKNLDLLTESYDYILDPALIADRPVAGRHNSKLLVYDQASDTITHAKFTDLAGFLPDNSLLTLNQSMVFPCRLNGLKPSGGRVELFLLSLIKTEFGYPALIGSNGKKRVGDKYSFNNLEATLVHRNEEGDIFVEFNVSDLQLINLLEEQANIPIPPYIRDGVSDAQDLVDYQTVYAKDKGSVAAPTAGLHFTEDVFNDLSKKNIETSFVTLHVGAGTFKPVSAENILDHNMHSEYYTVDTENLSKINSNKKIFAVGTTSLRVLESIYSAGEFVHEESKMGCTNIFLYPGKDVQSIKGLITNFHLPKSTLLMLVSSLLGREKTLELYDVAIKNNYRFFSYGDAMLIIRK